MLIRVTIEFDIDPAHLTTGHIMNQLREAHEFCLNRGVYTGDTAATIEGHVWDCEVVGPVSE